jgi:outer membrane receptor protein involved in Fe transport
MTPNLRRRLIATTFLAAMSAPVAAFAAAAPAQETALEEIVVTAQHVTENIQKAAISATVTTGENMVTRGIFDVSGLARLVPALTITPNNGYTNYNIRGVTSGGTNAFSDTGVAVNYNQVSLAFPSSAAGLYYDLERVELLNGPQGILYGRNATAGAVNVVARKPTFGDRISGYVGADFGNYDQINGRLAVNMPLSDKVAVRVAAQSVNRGGLYSDGSSNVHDNAIRASVYAEPTERLSLYLTADYAKTNSKGAGVTLAKQCGTNPQKTGNDAIIFCFAGKTPRTGLEDLYSLLPDPRPRSDNDSYYWGVIGTLEYKTDYGTLTVIPAYRRVSSHTWSNNAGFGSLIAFDDPKQTSIEARFQSGQDQRLRYQFGAYGLWAPIKGVGGSETPGARTWSNQFYDQDTKSKAAFGQLTFAVTEGLRVVGGLRYTKDTKTSFSSRYTLFNTYGTNPNLFLTPAGPAALPHSAAAAGAGNQYSTLIVAPENFERSWDKVTYKAGVEWDVTQNSFAYFDVRSGFKSGGFFFAPQPGGVTTNGIGSIQARNPHRLFGGFEEPLLRQPAAGEPGRLHLRLQGPATGDQPAVDQRPDHRRHRERRRRADQGRRTRRRLAAVRKHPPGRQRSMVPRRLQQPDDLPADRPDGQQRDLGLRHHPGRRPADQHQRHPVQVRLQRPRLCQPGPVGLCPRRSADLPDEQRRGLRRRGQPPLPKRPQHLPALHPGQPDAGIHPGRRQPPLPPAVGQVGRHPLRQQLAQRRGHQ